MNTQQIFVLVGKQVRTANARITPSGIAIIETSSGPVEFRKWYETEAAAKAEALRKAKR